MKVLLINPSIREWSRPNVAPLGLMYIASVLRDSGHEVEIMDINAFRWDHDEVEERISKADFDLVGIGAIVTVYKYVKWLVSVLKKYHPGRKIIVGGSVGTSIPRIVLEKAGADICCIGEGEVTAREVVECLQRGGDLSKVDGIWYRAEDGSIQQTPPRAPIADLDSIPFPAWDLVPMDIYLRNPVGAPNRNKWIDGSVGEDTVLSMNLSATRGCPYQCIYCYHDFMGQKYRHRSPGNIIAEMKELRDRYEVPYFHFVDDEFCLKKNFVFEFCEGVVKEFGKTVTWGCSGRVNLMTEEMIRTMSMSGCVLLAYGIESGSQKMLDIMKKKVTVEQAKEAIGLTIKHIGWADCSFIVGLPGETRETAQETVDFCKETGLKPEVIFFATPYPGTELYDIALRDGKIKDEEQYILNLGEQGEEVRVNFTHMSDEELVEVQESMISELDAWNKIKHPEAR